MWIEQNVLRIVQSQILIIKRSFQDYRYKDGIEKNHSIYEKIRQYFSFLKKMKIFLYLFKILLYPKYLHSRFNYYKRLKKYFD